MKKLNILIEIDRINSGNIKKYAFKYGLKIKNYFQRIADFNIL